jgi:S1-C subfamily serine protease
VQPVKITPKIDYLTPFAKISLIFEKSPAESAGLKVGDLVSEFADVTIYSMDWIKQLGQTVREGEELKLVILRPVA